MKKGFIKKLFSKAKEKQPNLELQEHKALYLSLNEEVGKKLDVYEIYKDILNLKMIIKLILTKEQFAAIKFCGCNININEFKLD